MNDSWLLFYETCKRKVDNYVDRVSDYLPELLNCLGRKTKLGLMIAEAMDSILIQWNCLYVWNPESIWIKIWCASSLVWVMFHMKSLIIIKLHFFFCIYSSSSRCYHVWTIFLSKPFFLSWILYYQEPNLEEKIESS